MAERPDARSAPGTNAAPSPAGRAAAVLRAGLAVAAGGAARAVGLLVAIVVVTSVATGWLYWIRAGVARWGGPRVRDALPLDELPFHGAVPLVVFLVAFAAAGLALGLAARAVRLERLLAALVLAAGVGAWMYAAGAFSVFVVRQVSFTDALHAAARFQAVYLAGALAGIGGALFGRPRSAARTRPATLLAWVVGAAGIVDLVSAITPEFADRLELVERVAPHAVPSVASALVVPVGVLLVLAARGLARGNRRAWRLALALLGASAVLNLVKGLDYEEAIVTGAIALALLARRRDFASPGDPDARPRAALRLLGVLGAAIAYGVVALWVNRTLSDEPFRLGLTLVDTARALVGLPLHGGRALRGSFPQWFPWSVLSIAAIGVAWSAATWVAPWRDRLSEDAHRRSRALAAVRRWGTDTLAPFALRADKSLFFHPERPESPVAPGHRGPEPAPGQVAPEAAGEAGEVLVPYRVVRGVALVSGDPVGPPEEVATALDAFLGHARERGWRVAVLGASDRNLDLYRSRGLRVLYHGDEAVIDVERFSLEGRPIRKVRQSVHRLRRAGYRAEALSAGQVDAVVRAELAAVERSWRAGRPRTGFVMELDELFRLSGEDAIFVLGRGPDGRVGGFLHLAVCSAAGTLSLSSMPRLRDTPNGLNEWLIVEAAEWARANGYRALSLNFSPFAGLLDGEAELSRLQRIEREALLALKGRLSLQLDNLLAFNQKFFPGWQRRFVVYERLADLPRVVLAAMAAEGYLPLANRVRGRGWAVPAPDAEPGPAPDAEPGPESLPVPAAVAATGAPAPLAPSP